MPAILDTLAQRLVADGTPVTIAHGLLVVQVPAAAVPEFARYLKSDLRFDMLVDITAIDWPGRDLRFDVVYHFYATTLNVRLRMKTAVPESDPAVATLTTLYGSAAFMERETHDMYGIVFRGNADLRPILLYEGFVGHPLRKDYPKEREQPLVPYRTP
jgi:NADH-quinone oxidoreductase subunit C